MQKEGGREGEREGGSRSGKYSEDTMILNIQRSSDTRKNKASARDTRCQIEFNKFFCGSEETMLRYEESFHCYPGLLDVEVLRAGALGYHVILCLSSYP